MSNMQNLKPFQDERCEMSKNTENNNRNSKTAYLETTRN